MPEAAAAKKIGAVIVDDELHGRENLKMLLELYCPEVNILACAESAVSAKECVIALNPDLVFLDINMPGLDGFDFLNEFEYRRFKFIFVTAHEDYGIHAVKAGASDYVLKPVNIKELKQAVNKIVRNSGNNINIRTEPEQDKLMIPSSHGFNVLLFNEIIRIEADGCYSKVFTKNGKGTIVSRTLKDFEKSLPEEKFFRIHKSHLINVDYIKEYSNYGGNHITMHDGSRIEISRRRAPDFLQKIKTTLSSV